MTDQETPTQPLIRHASVAGAASGRPSRAFKVAGITLLAGVLIVGQATIAYFLLSQRGDIKSLQDQNDDMKVRLSNGVPAAAPVEMKTPMRSMSMLMMDNMDVEASAGTSERKSSPEATTCQLEAAGAKPARVHGFLPTCDARGLYQRQQCFMRTCWCVNIVTGEEIPGTAANGAVSCMAQVRTGPMSKMLSLPDE